MESKKLDPPTEDLLRKLKENGDAEVWKEFYDKYSRFIYGIAIQAQLMASEAEDVVQETMVTIAKNLKDFEYDASRGTFEGYLRRTTNWRIIDEVRKRQHRIDNSKVIKLLSPTGSSLTKEPADPQSWPGEEKWDDEYKTTLLEIAMERLKRQASVKQFQVFDLLVMKGWPPKKIAETLEVSLASVYVTKHRLQPLLKKELEQLKQRQL
jgi:RNA polymerase sigma factor (sigma-70 family)